MRECPIVLLHSGTPLSAALRGLLISAGGFIRSLVAANPARDWTAAANRLGSGMPFSSRVLFFAMAASSFVASPLVAAAADGAGSAALPTGDDRSYRKEMLDWNAPPAPEVRWRSVDAPLGLPLARMGRLSSSFGVRSDPMGRGHRMHSGIDIPGALGTPVLSAGPGRVAFSGWAGGYGNLVVVDHSNGMRTRYGHLLRSTVTPGDIVGAGTVIGLMGSTGRSTGSHLHYEIRIGGTAVNPLASRYSVQSELPMFDDEALSKPVVRRFQGWTQQDAGDQLPVAVIR